MVFGEVEMQGPDPKKIARIAALQKTAGEVRFIKDRSGDSKEWAWGPPGASERAISDNFIFNAKELKPLALTLRSALMALGHATSAHARFVKIKSRNVSPDGALGGQGYIQKVSDLRRQLMNCIEVLSAFTDTVYDEIKAPHWQPAEDKLTPRDRKEVKQIVEESTEIKDDPENWAEEEEAEEAAQKKPAPKKVNRSKKASTDPLAHVASQIMMASEDFAHTDPMGHARLVEAMAGIYQFMQKGSL